MKIKQSLSSNAGDECNLGGHSTVVGGHRAGRAEGGETHVAMMWQLPRWLSGERVDNPFNYSSSPKTWHFWQSDCRSACRVNSCDCETLARWQSRASEYLPRVWENWGALAIQGFRILVACVGLLSEMLAHAHMIYAAETWTDVMVGMGAAPRDVVRGA